MFEFQTVKGGIFLLKLSRTILQIIVIALSGYILVTQRVDLLPLMMLCLAALMLVTGLSELQKEKKYWGYLSIIVSLFALFVSMQGFILG